MIEDIEHRIVKLKNEVKALKSTALFSGEHVPVYDTRAYWEGDIDGNEAINRGIPAIFEMTFTRTDGIKKTPLVDFAFDVDPPADEGFLGTLLTGAIVRTTEESATYRIPLLINNYGHFERKYNEATYSFIIVGHVFLRLTAAAYSIVPGKLTIERLYRWT